MSTAIKIENLYKEYRLGIIGHGTIYRDLQSWSAKLKGKPDPNSLLISDNSVNSNQRILALNNINLEVNDGVVLGIIGPNGAGKSTLLKILSKVTAPTSGRVKYNGKIASLLEVGTGFHAELTGRENIFLNGAINGMNKTEVSSKLDEIVDFAGVEQFLDTPVKRYSSGMYVRLGFAVAAHLDPDILIVDEVLAVGDAAFQKKAIRKMKEVSSGTGRTVLFVSHNMASIENLCKEVILIEKGSISEKGSPRKIIDKYLNRDDNLASTYEIATTNEKDKVLKLIHLSNEKGDRTGVFKVGENINFNIFFDSGVVPIKSPRILIAVTNKNHGPICYFSSDQMVNRPFEIKGKTLIKCVWNKCYLIPGNYFISLKFQGNKVESTQNICQFKIEETDVYKTGKEISGNPKTVIFPNGEWIFQNNRE